MSSPSPSSSQKKTPSLKVDIKFWDTVAKWDWSIDDDSCSICKNEFDAPCPKCKYPGDDCLVLFGQCGHQFHSHCILKWLSDDQTGTQPCPLCRQPWDL